MSPPTPQLSRDLADFLIEFSIALHKHAMYPRGHPSLAPAAEAVAARAAGLVSGKGTLSLGIAADQLVIEGVATDPKNAVVRDLARRLHRHHLGGISFADGVTWREVEELLGLIAADPDRSGEPLGRQSDLLEAFAHIRLFPVAYDQLQLLGDETEEAGFQTIVGPFGQLWIGLAQAVLGNAGTDDTGNPVTQNPADLAEAIAEGENNPAYDQVIAGYLLQIAGELRNGRGPDATAVKSRMERLVAELDKGSLQRVLRMGDKSGNRRRFLADASLGMEVDAVLKLVEAAGTTEGSTVSHHMLRMLQKLGQHAKAGAGMQSQHAEHELRTQIMEMIEGWTLSDPTPDGYGATLQGIAATKPLFSAADDAVHGSDPERIIQIALETNVTGTTVLAAMKNLLASDRGGWLVEIMKDAESSTMAGEMWSAYATSEQLGSLLNQEQVDADMLDEIIANVGIEAAPPMLDTLVASESRQTRRMLLDRLVAFGAPVAPLALDKLADTRWYVIRNMLWILGGLPEIPEGFDPAEFFQHEDSRVRRESLRVMFKLPHARERGICYALADTDERIVRLALAAAAEACPRAALPLVVSKARTAHQSDVRLAAIRVLGYCKQPAALAALLSLTQPVKKFFRWKLPPKTPEFLAALDAMRSWSDDKRASDILATARKNRDREIVAAATKGLRSDA